MKYWEDFEVGERRVVGSCRVSREEIIAFAREFDPQPFHVDEAAASASIFGGLTASSCHTFSLVGRIHALRGERIALVANLGAESLRFPAPVRPGDELTLWSDCIATRASRSRPALGIVTTKTRLENQRGELAMEMSTIFMVQRRPDPAAAEAGV